MGRRPVVLLSRGAAYRARNQVTVAPLTTRVRGIRSEVGLGPQDGLPRPCVANLDNINTIRVGQLLERVSQLGADKIRSIEDAIHYALGLAH